MLFKWKPTHCLDIAGIAAYDCVINRSFWAGIKTLFHIDTIHQLKG